MEAEEEDKVEEKVEEEAEENTYDTNREKIKEDDVGQKEKDQNGLGKQEKDDKEEEVKETEETGVEEERRRGRGTDNRRRRRERAGEEIQIETWIHGGAGNFLESLFTHNGISCCIKEAKLDKSIPKLAV